MNILFSSKKLAKRLNDEREMLKAFGAIRSKRLKVVMTALFAASHLGELAPPYSPPHRCHELIGNRKGDISLDLDGAYRLIIRPQHQPLPQREEGGLDWAAVTVIKIIAVENTHG